MKKTKKILTGNKGFTLLEILVVLTIMGFLIAMVAPRLAGISSSAVDTVCDTNQSRTIQMVAAYFERAGEFPNKLTNIIVEDASNDDTIPTDSNGDPDDGQETLSEEFFTRVHPVIHFLNADEVDELAEMGINKVFNLNSYDNSTVAEADEGNPMVEIFLATGTGVMMSGMGVDSAGDWQVDATITDYGEADFIGRIIFGLGPESGLVTSGLVTNAAHCPGGLQNDDNITYNDYNLVVPRLAATVDRVEGAGTPPITDLATTPNGTQYLAYGYTEDDDISTGITAATVAADGTVTGQPDGLKTRLLTFEAQELYEYSTMCPEGHMFPADDSDFWAINPTGGDI